MGLRRPPYAFTEHGTLMAANVLNSARAVQMSVFVVRAFVQKKLTTRLDTHEITIVDVLRRVMRLLEPSPLSPDLPRRRIGFQSRK